MRVVLHPPTLTTSPRHGADRVGTVVMAAVHAELRRLGHGAAGAGEDSDATAGDGAAVDLLGDTAGPEPEPVT